jgi:hypothetical protein
VWGQKRQKSMLFIVIVFKQITLSDFDMFVEKIYLISLSGLIIANRIDKKTYENIAPFES